MEQKTAYIVYTNTDLTEGRGQQIVLGICELPTTAARIGARKYVQGSDCPVSPTTLYKHDGRWYGPVTVHAPTCADQDAYNVQVKKDAVLAKAKSLGLSEQEIELLSK